MEPDLFAPAFQEDPYPTYARLRRETPVYREPRYGVHWLTRFDDVQTALRDPATFSSAAGPGPLPSPAPGRLLASTDPPYHDQLRGLVNRAFTPRRVERMAPRIHELSRALVAELPPSFDLVPALSIPLPVIVIAEMLGVEPERHADFRRWSDAFVGLLENPPTQALQQTAGELVGYFRELLERRRRDPQDDLVSALLEAEIEGRKLEQDELDGFFIMLLVAGNETTTNLISNQLHALADRPELWKTLRDDRSQVPAALEETLRWDSPVQNLGRQTTCEVTIGGVTLPKGARVVTSFAAANRDPAVFPGPDEYRLDRGQARHLGFGLGTHFCLGAGLARLEGRLALDALLDRFDEIAPGDGPPRRMHSTVIRGFESLPLVGRA